MKLNRLPVDSFSWSRWRMCDIFLRFSFACRTFDIVRMRHVIRKYAVGYIDGSELVCRRKDDCIGVMFLIEDVFSWCHLRRDEFEVIFG